MPKSTKKTTKKVEEPKDEELNEIEKEEDKPEEGGFYAVFDPNGKYIRTYEDKKLAEEFTAKSTNKGKTIKKITAKEKAEFETEKAEEFARAEDEKNKLHKEGHLPITIH